MKVLISLFLLLITSIHITQAQNVGIGTSTPNPSAMLDVSSTTKGFLPPRMSTAQRIAISNPANSLVVYDTDLNGFWFYNGTAWKNLVIADSTVWSKNGNNIFNNNTGNVGIGTNTPNGELQFKNSANHRKIVLFENANNPHQFEGFGIETDKLRYQVNNPSISHAFFSGTGVNSSNELMRIQGNGNVGIGTSAPAEKLHIDGNIKLGGDVWASAANDRTINFGDEQFVSIGERFEDDQLHLRSDNGIIFRGANDIERMRISFSGNLGIGTSAPAAKLDVNGKTKTTSLQVTNGALAGNVLTSDLSGNASWQPVTNSSWGLYGNAGTTAANFIGTTDNQPLRFIVNNMNHGFLGIGNDNIALGLNSLNSNSTGAFNTAFGNAALQNSNGSINTAFGFQAMQNNINGDNNTAIGSGSLINSQGHNNTAIGNSSLNGLTTGSDNIGLGFSANVPNPTGNGQMSIANVIYGKNMTSTAEGKIGIGTSDPLAKLHVADSNVVFTGPTIITATTPYAPPVQGAGTRMMWYPQKAAFRVGRVNATQSTFWDKDNIGLYSFASGFGTKANGDLSTAMGYNTTASGNTSIATGNTTTASGILSTAMGESTTASGDGSTAMGINTFAKGLASLSIGAYNDATDSPNSNFEAPTDRIFQIGNGTDVARSNAMTVLRNGNTGIGTVNPTAQLHVDSGAVLFRGPVNLPATPGNPPISGAGTRMMWYADKAAFRAGGVNGTQWDKNNVGDNSVAIGINTTASGNFSFAMGGTTIASGPSSTAMGVQTRAKAINSLSIGSFNDDTDTPSPSTESITDRIFQIGNGNGIFRSNAMTVLRNGNVGIGITTPQTKLEVNGEITSTNPNSFRSVFLNYGSFLRNDGTGTFLLLTNSGDQYGSYNDLRPFSIDNATGNTQMGNTTLFVQHGGNVGIGTGAPTQKLHVIGNILATGTITPSDARYKKNIQTINSPLQKLQQLNGVTYNFNQSAFPEWQFGDKMQYGLIAQEVEKVFPEMVQTINADGYKGVEYVKLIPVLLEAIKELKKQNEEQQKQIDELKK